MVNESTQSMAGEPDRRQFIKGIAAPPTTAVLAGCVGAGGPFAESESRLEDIETGDTTDHAGAFRFSDRYAMEVENALAEKVTLSGRLHGENRVLKYNDGGEPSMVSRIWWSFSEFNRSLQ